MSRADDSIKTIDGIICNNIDHLVQNNPGLMSQNVLSQLRNFVEAITVKIFGSNDSDPNDYKVIQESLGKLRQSGKKYRFLNDFHKSLQITESHYTQDEDNSERMLDNYLQYLFKLRAFFKAEYGVVILHNLEKIQFINDPYSKEYYEKVAATIINHNPSGKIIPKERYYILNTKLFCINGKLFYEITFVPVNSTISKFDRLIAYSDEEPMYNYSINMNLVDDKINILDMYMKIAIMESWMVSIRPCELKNYSKIFGDPIAIDPGLEEYRILMKYMTDTGDNLLDLLEKPNKDLLKLFNTRTRRIYQTLVKTRYILNNNYPGSNVIRYLLYQLRNDIIKLQLSEEQCNLLSQLFLSNKCVPFDRMPFCTSLAGHNPSSSDLIKCLDINGREHEILARKITNLSENEGSLFVKINDDCNALIAKYNAMLYYRHDNRKLIVYSKYAFIKGRTNEISLIIRKIQSFGKYHIENYRKDVQNIIKKKSIEIDCDIKREIVEGLYEDKSVAFIYGAAGTGKTTLIRHVSCIFSEWKKLFLANTNSAVQNLRQKIKEDENSSFMTVKQYYSNHYNDYQLIVIDECSTISNEDILKVLNKSKEKSLFLFVGDIFQLKSIRFGNWFKIIGSYVPKNAIHNLSNVYRTNEPRLLEVWKNVRASEDGILERLIKYGFSSEFDKTIFQKKAADEIVLCLNYNGIYGINNINQILQIKNKNEPITWGHNNYKIEDPILFNESNRFSPIIHNNMKGVIKGIEKHEEKILFEIEVESEIKPSEARLFGIAVIGKSNGKTRIKFAVKKYEEGDDDTESMDTVVPFNIAYAISIHKSQGLEYDSVKVVISDNVEDKITQNVFYTAITRAKKDLKIYWSKKASERIVQNFKQGDMNREVQFINQICNFHGKYYKIE